MENHYVEYVFGLACLIVLAGSAVSAQSQTVVNDPSSSQEATSPDTLTPKRQKKNHDELQKMLLVDSLSWLKANATRSADTKDAEVTSVYNQRRVARLKGFCNDKRFASLSEVDLLTEMTSEERGFCKDRLKLLNPLMP